MIVSIDQILKPIRNGLEAPAVGFSGEMRSAYLGYAQALAETAIKTGCFVKDSPEVNAARERLVDAYRGFAETRLSAPITTAPAAITRSVDIQVQGLLKKAGVICGGMGLG